MFRTYILANLSTLSIFSSVISQTALIPSSRCCSFLKIARDIYASYALSYLNSAGQVTAANLDSLGICFASNIPAQRLLTLSVSDFLSRISYFIGAQVQLNTASATALGTLINSAVGTYTLENLIFTILQDAAIYATNFTGISSVKNFV